MSEQTPESPARPACSCGDGFAAHMPVDPKSGLRRVGACQRAGCECDFYHQEGTIEGRASSYGITLIVQRAVNGWTIGLPALDERYVAHEKELCLVLGQVVALRILEDYNPFEAPRQQEPAS